MSSNLPVGFAAAARLRAGRRLAVAPAVVMAVAVTVAGSAAARSAPDSFADLAARLSPSVVNISTTQRVAEGGLQPEFQVPPGSPFKEFFDEFFERNRPQQRSRRATSLGSGFIIDTNGLVVTNNHVIAEAEEISVRLSDGTKLDAEVAGRDPKTDLALLRVKSDKPLPALSWGNSDTMRVGDWVLAIGNPFGLGGSVTAGIISARGRDINSGPYDDFIQTDASINRGNSGGPLFNMDGQIIGINTAIFSPSGGSVGIGFAIPATLARNIIEQLEEHGRTRRGWLGVRIQTVTEEIAEGLGMPQPKGALVAGVTDDGPAAKGGIEQGDVIVKFDGKDVDEMRSLPRIVAETRIGSDVAVVVWRKGQQKNLTVQIGELDEEAAQAVAAEESGEAASELVTLGMTLSTITPDLRERFELSAEIGGVLVTDVEADGPAAEKGIRPGDIIVEVQQDEVAKPEDVQEKVDQLRNENKNNILLLLRQRAGELRFVAVRLEKS